MGFWFEYDAELARKERDAEIREEAYAESYAEAYAKAFAEAYAEAYAEARLEERVALIKNLLVAKTPLKYIVAATGWSEERILELAEGEINGFLV